MSPERASSHELRRTAPAYPYAVVIYAVGAFFVLVGAALLITAGLCYRVVSRQGSRLGATVAAMLFGGPGAVIALFGVVVALFDPF